MSLFTPSRGPAHSIPTSSMADVAFLLLIFFLVTTVFPRNRGLALVLPKEGVMEVPASNVLHLLVLPTGLVEVRRGDSHRGPRIRPEEVGPLWREAIVGRPGLIASVRTSPDARYALTMAVLDQLQLAGAERVSLQLLEP